MWEARSARRPEGIGEKTGVADHKVFNREQEQKHEVLRFIENWIRQISKKTLP